MSPQCSLSYLGILWAEQSRLKDLKAGMANPKAWSAGAWARQVLHAGSPGEGPVLQALHLRISVPEVSECIVHGWCAFRDSTSTSRAVLVTWDLASASSDLYLASAARTLMGAALQQCHPLNLLDLVSSILPL